MDGPSHYLRIQAEENALRDAAAQALAPLAATDADRVLLARLQGESALAREQNDEAVAAYERRAGGRAERPRPARRHPTAYRATHDYAALRRLRGPARRRSSPA